MLTKFQNLAKVAGRAVLGGDPETKRVAFAAIDALREDEVADQLIYVDRKGSRERAIKWTNQEVGWDNDRHRVPFIAEHLGNWASQNLPMFDAMAGVQKP
jgi:hypothetical protein